MVAFFFVVYMAWAWTMVGGVEQVCGRIERSRIPHTPASFDIVVVCCWPVKHARSIL